MCQMEVQAVRATRIIFNLSKKVRGKLLGHQIMRNTNRFHMNVEINHRNAGLPFVVIEETLSQPSSRCIHFDVNCSLEKFST